MRDVYLSISSRATKATTAVTPPVKQNTQTDVAFRINLIVQRFRVEPDFLICARDCHINFSLPSGVGARWPDPQSLKVFVRDLVDGIVLALNEVINDSDGDGAGDNECGQLSEFL
jgi:hypothetical protein